LTGQRSFKEPDVEGQMRLIKEYNVAFSFSSDKGEGDEDSPEKIKVCNTLL
jgi:histidinol phosphatase-like PHP family hydrolase